MNDQLLTVHIEDDEIYVVVIRLDSNLAQWLIDRSGQDELEGAIRKLLWSE